MVKFEGKTEAELAAGGYKREAGRGRPQMRLGQSQKTECTHCHRWFSEPVPIHDQDRNVLCRLCFSRLDRSGATDRL